MKKFNIPEVAVAELGPRSDDLRLEISKQEIELIPLSKKAKKQANAIRQRLKDDGKLDGKHAVSANDVRIIVIAMRRGLTLVTEEAQDRDRYNMSTVCRKKKVPHMNSAQLRAKTGIQ